VAHKVLDDRGQVLAAYEDPERAAQELAHLVEVHGYRADALRIEDAGDEEPQGDP
jgi:hypothetical protein